MVSRTRDLGANSEADETPLLISRDITLQHAKLRCITLTHVTLRCIILHYLTRHYVTLHYGMSHYINYTTQDHVALPFHT